MVDEARLTEFCRSNVEQISRKFFPSGRKQGNAWAIADITGAAGNSLLITLDGNGAGLWYDFATGEGGDLVRLLMLHFQVGFPKAVELIEHAFPVNFRVSKSPEPESPSSSTERSNCSRTASEPFNWGLCVERFTEQHAMALTKWRNYTIGFCRWLKERELVGLYKALDKHHIALPVKDGQGKIVGCHYYRSESHDWLYSPGCKVTPLVIGDPSLATRIDLFESYWDALAFGDKMQFQAEDSCALIITRGAANGRLVKGLLPSPDKCNVYVWPQRDIVRENGKAPSANWLAAVLGAVDRDVKIAWVPDLHPDRDFDVNDWTREGATTDDILAVCAQAQVALPQASADQEEQSDEEKRRDAFNRAIRKGSQVEDIDIPPKAVIIDDWFRAGDIGFLFAFRGAGKTWLVLHLCISLATGKRFGPWQVNGSWPVLYVDGEMTFYDNKSRILGLHSAVPEPLHVLNHEVLFHQEGLVMNLARRDDQEIIRQACLELNIKVLVLDNLGCLFTGVGENDAAEWEKILPWLLQLRRDGIAVVIVHHTGVDPSRMRGTTKREDPADWVLGLDNRKEDYSEEGAHFISRFRKYRGRKIVLDYEWRFSPSANNEVTVTFKEANRADLVLQLVIDGLTSCDDIAKELGLSKGTVSKLAKKLIAEGKLTKRGRSYELPTV
jgi:hypothetical protein